MSMNAKIAKSLGGIALSLVFSIGCAYIAFDYIARRHVVWMGVLVAWASIVATAALVLKITVLLRLIRSK